MSATASQETYSWLNAQELQKMYPDSFQAPTIEELNSIQVGDFVKICNGFERFFCEVKHIEDDFLIGRIDNKLIGKYAYQYNDYIEFQRDHVYNIHSSHDLLNFRKQLSSQIQKSKK